MNALSLFTVHWSFISLLSSVNVVCCVAALAAELYDAVTVPGHSGHCCDSLCCDGMMTLRGNYGHTGHNPHQDQ